MSTHFILIRALSHSARQISSRLSFSRGEFKKNQMSSVYRFGTIHNHPFQRRWLYRLIYQLAYRFVFFLFPLPFSEYMRSFLLILLIYLLVWQRAVFLVQHYARLLSNALGAGGGEGVGSKTPNQQIWCFTNSRFSTSLVPHTGIPHF